jgi:hypothetical protein
MPVVTIACPRTGKFVSTGMELEPSGFDGLGPKIFRVRCPACASEHLWSRGTAWLSPNAKEPAANDSEEVDLLKEAHALTRPHPIRDTRSPGQGRVDDIIDRLLETIDTGPGISPTWKTRK